jgi:hypothetical protein
MASLLAAVLASHPRRPFQDIADEEDSLLADHVFEFHTDTGSIVYQEARAAEKDLTDSEGDEEASEAFQPVVMLDADADDVYDLDTEP